MIIATARLRNSLLRDMQYDKFRSLVTPDLGVHLLAKDGLLNRVSLVTDFVSKHFGSGMSAKSVSRLGSFSGDVVSVQLKRTHFFLFPERS